jgi:hypothetical protein
MNCGYYLELITAATDNELLDDEKKQLDSHLLECAHCRNELELETATKHLLQKTFSNLKTPWKVRANIIEDLRGEPGFHNKKKIFWEFPLWRPVFTYATAFAAVIIFIFYFLQQQPAPQTISKKTPEIAQQPLQQQQQPQQQTEINSIGRRRTAPKKNDLVGPSKTDVLEESMTDFDLYLQGKKQPEKISPRPDEVQKYLASQVNFPVRLPKTSEYELQGASVSEIGEDKIAQLLYSYHGKTVTLYQTSFAAIRDGCAFAVPESIHTALANGGTYVDDSDPSCIITMWVEDDMLYYAIGATEKEEILQELSKGFQSVRGHK